MVGNLAGHEKPAGRREFEGGKVVSVLLFSEGISFEKP
jgi:hypothetical protein